VRPYLPLQSGRAAPPNPYSGYVEYSYQAKSFSSACYVRTHDWCSDDQRLGRSCTLPDCAALGCSITDPGACTQTCQFKVTALPTFMPRLQVLMDLANHGWYGEDRIHVTGTAESGQMGVEYTRIPLIGSAGQLLTLPEGVRAAATWCTGEDIWNAEHAIVCDADIALEPGFENLQCDAVERCTFLGKQFINGSCVSPVNYDRGSDGSLIQDPLVTVDGRTYDTFQIAAYFGTSEIDLARELPSAEGLSIGVLDPGVAGQVSFAWTDADAVTHNTVTIDPGGTIIKLQTR
jgi:hypothetical protein